MVLCQLLCEMPKCVYVAVRDVTAYVLVHLSLARHAVFAKGLLVAQENDGGCRRTAAWQQQPCGQNYAQDFVDGVAQERPVNLKLDL